MSYSFDEIEEFVDLGKDLYGTGAYGDFEIRDNNLYFIILIYKDDKYEYIMDIVNDFMIMNSGYVSSYNCNGYTVEIKLA